MILASKLFDPQLFSKSDFEILLSDVEKKMKEALPLKQAAMNRCLCEIGIRYDNYTDRCISIGEKLGVFRELKVSKGWTSSYALEWIRAGRANRKK